MTLMAFCGLKWPVDTRWIVAVKVIIFACPLKFVPCTDTSITILKMLARVMATDDPSSSELQL
jgi:hypothetical protein